jgi:hypothetical protein
MGIFCDKEETEEQIVIRVRYAWFYVWLGGAFVCIFLGKSFSGVFFVPAVVFLILMIVFAVAYWPVSAEIRKAMRNGMVKVSGSKYSFSDPLTFVITKTTKINK